MSYEHLDRVNDSRIKGRCGNSEATTERIVIQSLRWSSTIQKINQLTDDVGMAYRMQALIPGRDDEAKYSESSRVSRVKI